MLMRAHSLMIGVILVKASMTPAWRNLRRRSSRALKTSSAGEGQPEADPTSGRGSDAPRSLRTVASVRRGVDALVAVHTKKNYGFFLMQLQKRRSFNVEGEEWMRMTVQVPFMVTSAPMGRQSGAGIDLSLLPYGAARSKR